jgi:hypothetical protein
MYHKLKSVVDSWNREERGKAKVVVGALYGLLAWFAAVTINAFLFPTYGGLLVPVGGFLAWAVFVVGLVWWHLGSTRRGL